MSLRDQFKKANLLSDKDARRLVHEARVERSEKGQPQLDQEEQRRQQELVKQQEAERRRAAKEQQQLQAQRQMQEEVAAVDAILATETRRPGTGPAKFYFETEDASLPCLELSPRDAQQVAGGMLCIVRAGPRGTHDYKLLATELARRVAKVRPEVIAFAPRGVVS